MSASTPAKLPVGFASIVGTVGAIILAIIASLQPGDTKPLVLGGFATILQVIVLVGRYAQSLRLSPSLHQDIDEALAAVELLQAKAASAKASPDGQPLSRTLAPVEAGAEFAPITGIARAVYPDPDPEPELPQSALDQARADLNGAATETPTKADIGDVDAGWAVEEGRA